MLRAPFPVLKNESDIEESLRQEAEAPRQRLFLMEEYTGIEAPAAPAINYVEKDPTIPLEGLIGFQAHSGSKFVIQFKDITLSDFPPMKNPPAWEGVELKAWPKRNREIEPF